MNRVGCVIDVPDFSLGSIRIIHSILDALAFLAELAAATER
ncbi:MAG: hypothetical protein AAFO04_21195 [Cyanobacteria bacterium J06592_8]